MWSRVGKFWEALRLVCYLRGRRSALIDEMVLRLFHSSVRILHTSLRLIAAGYHQYMSIASHSFGWASSWRLDWLACVGERACLREAQGDFSAQLLMDNSVKELLPVSTHAGSVCICVPEARPGPGREPPPATDETQSTSLLCLHSLPGRLICLPPGSFGFEPQNHT